MANRKGTQFNCFSPPVMLATLVIEFTLAAYTIWRYKLNVLSRLVTTILVTLAVFQLSEYFVCTGSAGNVSAWSRLGFAAITALPALGLHVLHVLASKRGRYLVPLAYGMMISFIGFFLLYDGAFYGHQCTGNYVIFQIAYTYGGWFTTYYYVWLVIAIGLAVYWAGQLQAQGAKSKKRLQSVWALVAGYLVFLLPTITANTVSPTTRQGIPSVMCGFAVLFALILALYVLPRMGTRRNLTNSADKVSLK